MERSWTDQDRVPSDRRRDQDGRGADTGCLAEGQVDRLVEGQCRAGGVPSVVLLGTEGLDQTRHHTLVGGRVAGIDSPAHPFQGALGGADEPGPELDVAETEGRLGELADAPRGEHAATCADGQLEPSRPSRRASAKSPSCDAT